MYNVHSPNLFKIPKQKFQEYKIQNYILKTVIIFHAYLMKLNNIYLTIKGTAKHKYCKSRDCLQVSEIQQYFKNKTKIFLSCMCKSKKNIKCTLFM